MKRCSYAMGKCEGQISKGAQLGSIERVEAERARVVFNTYRLKSLEA